MKFVHVKGVTNKETEIKPDKTKIINNYMHEKKSWNIISDRSRESWY